MGPGMQLRAFKASPTDHAGEQNVLLKASSGLCGHRLTWLAAVFAVELLISFWVSGYYFDETLEASRQPLRAPDVLPGYLGAIGLAPVALLIACIFVGLSCLLRPNVAGELIRSINGPEPRGYWLGLHLLGWMAFFAPAAAASLSNAQSFDILQVVWVCGAVLAAVSAFYWVSGTTAPLRPTPVRWIGLGAFTCIGAMIVGLKLEPWLWNELGPQGLYAATFHSVALLLSAIGFAPFVDAADVLVGVGDFAVTVGASCSGVQGLILVFFTTIACLAIHWRSLRLPRALILLPIALGLAWSLNVVRIAILILIGDLVSPELAVGGFHSYAGWILFVLLSGLVFIMASRWRWIQSRHDMSASNLPSIARDPVAALILPFLVFLGSSLVVEAITLTPQSLYPWRALALAAVLGVFIPLYAKLSWQLDWRALAYGALVAALWIMNGEFLSEEDAISAEVLGGSAVLWIAVRVAATAMLVPIAEEGFFRGYLLGRFSKGGIRTAAIPLVLSSILFGMLHAEWMLATLAGLGFGIIYLRRRSLVDAIVAHAAANILIALWAVGTGNYAFI